MKLLTNTNLHSRGGIAKRADEMIRYCREEDIPLVVVGAVPGEDYHESHEGGVSFYRIPLPKGLERSAQIYEGLEDVGGLRERLTPATDAIKRIMDKEKVDVVLSEGTFYSPWMVHGSAKDLGLPTIVHYAGILTKEEKDAPKPLFNLFSGMEQDFNRKDNFYVFPSELTKSEVEKIFGREISSGVVIPNGISREFFDQASAKRDKKSIGFVGRNHPVKNVEFLLDLADSLNSRGDDSEILAVSNVREGKPLRGEMVRRGIKLISGMGTKKLRDFYASLGALVSPSRFETYGNVPMEALASGTPALVNRNMGVAETFDGLGLSDFVLDNFENAGSVVDRINSAKEEGVREEVRESIWDNFQWKGIMKRYFDYCASVAS